MGLQVLFSSTLSSLSRLGIAVLPRPSGLSVRRPEATSFEYSLMSRYSGFLYQVSHDGKRMAATVGLADEYNGLMLLGKLDCSRGSFGDV